MRQIQVISDSKYLNILLS